ncbi:MAG: hypothetical protein QOE90_2831 [Thermoplasmata archaeon]|jgi:plastocyanin|nr:hypothetical protein [Thermoplasmata archaeon]
MRVLLLLVALATVMAGCASPDTTPSTTTPASSTPVSSTPATPTPAEEQADITIAGFAFSPASYPEELGGTVSWQNLDTTTHTVTADDGSFDSGPLAPGAWFNHTFPAAGVVAYHCKIHASMHGSLTIGNVTNQTPTPSSTPPAPTTPSSPTPTSSTPPASSTPPSPSPPPDQTVTIQGFAYAPETLTVPVGTTVVWHDLDAAPHGAVADDGSWTTGVVSSGASGSRTFTTTGTWTYHCPVHGQSMTGTIVVT